MLLRRVGDAIIIEDASKDCATCVHYFVLSSDFKIDVEKVFDCISLEKPNLWDQFSLMRLAAKSLVSRDRRNENSSVSPHTGLESLKWPLRWLWVPVPVSALPAFLTSVRFYLH